MNCPRRRSSGPLRFWPSAGERLHARALLIPPQGSPPHSSYACDLLLEFTARVRNFCEEGLAGRLADDI
jgi:hypothetical protein